MFAGDRVERSTVKWTLNPTRAAGDKQGKDFLIVLLSIRRDMGRLVAIETDHQQRIVTVVRAHQAIDPLRTKAPHTPIMR